MKQNNYLTKGSKVSDEQALLHSTVIKETTHTYTLENLLRSIYMADTALDIHYFL